MENAIMKASRHCLALSIALGTGLWPHPGRGTVLFQNGGTRAGWDSSITQHIGTITDVPSPVYKGATSLRMEQTFQGFDGYHSEVRKHDAEKPGEDLYFGEALGLPESWKFHDQNVTFQQFARSDVFGSAWALMFIQNDHLYLAHVAPGHADLGSVAGMQGKWIRIVTRLKLGSNGLAEVWVNGVKKLSYSGTVQPGPGLPVRWSVGMYCTYWRREQPAGLDPMVLFHDHLRIATTYEEADPASWDDDGTPPVPAQDGGALDAGVPSEVEAGDAAPRPDAAGSGSGGGPEMARDAASPRRDGRASAGEAGAPGMEPEGSGGSSGTGAAPKPATSTGCQMAATPGAPGALAATISMLLVAGLWRVRRRRRGHALEKWNG
jgi:MYXO-CTERM domain-containing protein